jgi:hypothetical protein
MTDHACTVLTFSVDGAQKLIERLGETAELPLQRSSANSQHRQRVHDNPDYRLRC